MLRRILIYLFHLIWDDRRVLKTIIFPYFSSDRSFSKILFVGCRWYTSGYDEMFHDKDYWTLDIDPLQSKYGASNHISDSIENLHLHFSANELDLIILNGVFGAGLNSRPDVEKAFRNCFECLREGGVLVLGWNDIPRRRPFPLEQCQSLKLFECYFFQPLSASEYLTDTYNRHTYSFYVK